MLVRQEGVGRIVCRLNRPLRGRAIDRQRWRGAKRNLDQRVRNPRRMASWTGESQKLQHHDSMLRSADRSFKFPLQSDSPTSTTASTGAAALNGAANIGTSTGPRGLDTGDSIQSVPDSATLNGDTSSSGITSSTMTAEPSNVTPSNRDRLDAEPGPDTPTLTITPPDKSVTRFIDDDRIAVDEPEKKPLEETAVPLDMPAPPPRAHEKSNPPANGDHVVSPSKASTIEDAIAEFHDAVRHGVTKTPRPVPKASTPPRVSAAAPEATDAAPLELGVGAVQVTTPKSTVANGSSQESNESIEADELPTASSPPAKAVNAARADQNALGPDSPVPFRRHPNHLSGRPPERQEIGEGEDAVVENEGTTMDEIDLQ